MVIGVISFTLVTPENSWGINCVTKNKTQSSLNFLQSRPQKFTKLGTELGEGDVTKHKSVKRRAE